MVMNKKGQALIYFMLIAVVAFLVAVILTEPLKDMIDVARDSDHLDCSNTSISTGTKGTCLIVDLYLPYFVLAVIVAGIGVMFQKQYG